MRIVNLEQGSKEWLIWRESRLTATDIPVILGSNPFKNKLQLWEEKLGFREPTKLNAAMERGQKLEPEARLLASKELSLDFEPVVVESEEFPWLAASLDGISIGWDVILEIKCPGESTHLSAINQIVPPYYQDQMQTQMLVTNTLKCFYVSYRPENIEFPLVIIEIQADLEKQKIIKKNGLLFYQNMCTMNPPTEWKLNKK